VNTLFVKYINQLFGFEKKLRCFFSKICINEWLSRVQTCPIDRTPMESDQLKPVPRILKNLLCRLVFIFEKIPEKK